MTLTSHWPPTQPFPPTPDQDWTIEQKRYLLRLLHWRWQSVEQRGDISEEDIHALATKLATPKGVRRFHRVYEYTTKHEQKEISYLDWIDRVIKGYVELNIALFQEQETSDGIRPALYKRLLHMVGRSYRKVADHAPASEQSEDMASILLLCLIEDYYYDTPLEQWLWCTARHIALNELRDPRNRAHKSIDDVVIQDSSINPLEWYLTHDALRRSIRQIDYQPYRVILLLLYLYRMNNPEMAAFFGVTIPRVTTWLSRARSALRKYFPSE